MIYRPKKVAEMWDTWLYFHEGTHYLFYLHKSDGDKWDGMSVATSKDGVHYDEVGPIISKRGDATWLGTGSVWEADGRFVLNFSESRDGVQAIFFAESDDLVHWRRLGDELRSDPDPRWYDDSRSGRWDCIWSISKPTGSGLYGYLTARPWSKTPGMRFESVGMVESDNGFNWRAVAPPPIEWGDWTPMNLGEVGAIEKINERYFLMLGYGECALGNRWAWNDLNNKTGGMFCFVSDAPEGPFRPDKEAYRLLNSNGTYFSRFYRTPNEVLVNHHSFEQEGGTKNVWMAPLKRAVVDDAGHLRLGYWDGNERLKGDDILNDLSLASRLYPTLDPGTWTATPNRLIVDEPVAGGITILGASFEPSHGVILEADITIVPSDRPWSGIGLLVEEQSKQGDGAGSGTAILMQTRGRSDIGTVQNANRGSFAPHQRIDVGIAGAVRHSVRLLLRRKMIECYLDDMLLLCHSVEHMPSGRLGLVHEAGRAVFENVRTWEMKV